MLFWVEAEAFLNIIVPFISSYNSLPIWLFRRHVHSANSKGEPAKRTLRKSSFLEDVHHLFSLRESFNRCRQVFIGIPVFRNFTSIQWQESMGVQMKQLPKRKFDRSCQFDDAQMSSVL
jgi:hypothetical protein